MSSWQLIFAQSKVNDARYDGDRLLRKIGIGLKNLVSDTGMD